MTAIAVYEWVDGNQAMTETRDDFVGFVGALDKLGPGVLAELMDDGCN